MVIIAMAGALLMLWVQGWVVRRRAVEPSPPIMAGATATRRR